MIPAIAFLVGFLSLARQGPSVELIAIPPPPGYAELLVTKMCSDGNAVLATGKNGNRFGTSFIWRRDTGWQSIGTLDGYGYSVPSAAASDLSTVVGICGKNDVTPYSVGYIWTKDGGMKEFLPSDTEHALPREISADGLEVTGALVHGTDTLHPRPFHWTAARGLEILGAAPGTVDGMSADGSIAVGHFESDSDSKNPIPHAFMWTAEAGFKNLSTVKLPVGQARAISADGKLIYGLFLEGEYIGRTYKLSPDGWAPLDPPCYNLPDAVSNDGSELVGEGEIWSKYGFLETHDYLEALGIDVPGGRIRAVSSDGTHFLLEHMDQDHSTAFILTSPGILPIALKDRYGADKPEMIDVPAKEGILRNDAAGVGATVELLQAPKKAKVFKLNPDGSFHYEPVAKIKGEDFFTYRALTNDGKKTNVARVEIAFWSAR